MYPRYSTAGALAKAKRYALSAHLLAPVACRSHDATIQNLPSIPKREIGRLSESMIDKGGGCRGHSGGPTTTADHPAKPGLFQPCCVWDGCDMKTHTACGVRVEDRI